MTYTTALILRLRDALQGLLDTYAKRAKPNPGTVAGDAHEAVTAANTFLNNQFPDQSETWTDKPDQWTAEIEKAHPVNTGDHRTYATAQEMVGNRHSKGVLVELVNWLLASKARFAEGRLVAQIEHLEGSPARIVRVMDVSELPHGTNLYAYSDRQVSWDARNAVLDDAIEAAEGVCRDRQTPVWPSEIIDAIRNLKSTSQQQEKE